MSAEQRKKIGDGNRGQDRGGVGRDLRRAREWARENRERIAAKNREWARANPARRRINEAKRRALKWGSTGDGVTHRDWTEILGAFGHRCAYCADQSPLGMDHIEPLSKGGAHDVSNIAPACRACNSSKHNCSLIVWLARRALAA